MQNESFHETTVLLLPSINVRTSLFDMYMGDHEVKTSKQ